MSITRSFSLEMKLVEEIINLIFYIATGISVLACIFIWLGEIKLSEHRFIWYYYIPSAVINAGLGGIAPYLYLNGLLSISIGEAVSVYIFFIILHIVALIGSNITFMLLFRDKDNFSSSFYWCLSMTALFIIPYWIIKLFGI